MPEMSETPDLPEPMAAATLVLMREAREGPPELLMTERTGQMAFAAGALVFPGGRIDPADHEAAALFPVFEDSAARLAAIRETIEETGIAPAVTPQAKAAAMVPQLLAGLDRGLALLPLLEELGLCVDPGQLTPFARWCPNFRETRRFDTLFYLAEAPKGAPEPVAAEAEAVRAFWASAASILADLEAKRVHAIFPTRRNLERLARFSSIAEAKADAARHPVRQITPWVEERDGRSFVCIPENIGYPVTCEPLETARRR